MKTNYSLKLKKETIVALTGGKVLMERTDTQSAVQKCTVACC